MSSVITANKFVKEKKCWIQYWRCHDKISRFLDLYHCVAGGIPSSTCGASNWQSSVSGAGVRGWVVVARLASAWWQPQCLANFRTGSWHSGHHCASLQSSSFGTLSLLTLSPTPMIPWSSARRFSAFQPFSSESWLLLSWGLLCSFSYMSGVLQEALGGNVWLSHSESVDVNSKSEPPSQLFKSSRRIVWLL